MRRSESAIARRVDDEVVVLDVGSGSYFALNETGATIWDRLATDCAIDDLVEALCSTYDVARETATRDVEDLVRQLSEAGLVTGVV